VAADGDKVYLYVTMRRGGRVIYALDVSDPDDPKFLWRRDNTSAGYGELGQTWSEPKVRHARAYANPVLIFGAGYDAPVEDQDPVPAGVRNSMGRGVFVVDALTGAVVWQAGPVAPAVAESGATFLSVTGMTYAIPSDVAVIDRNSDGYADRVYVGDTGGRLWRIDIAGSKVSDWTVNLLATVGYAQYGTTASRRKFLFPPDVAYGSDMGGAYDAVLIGSGDRENPFNGSGDTAHPLANAVVNRYYMFKDRGTGNAFVGSKIIESDLYDATANLIQDGTTAQQTAAASALTSAAGWYVTLGTGEKVVGGSVTLAGTVFFNTNQPTFAAPGVCGGNLGTARNYALSFENAAATINFTAATLSITSRSLVRPGGGYPPTPVPVFVKINGRVQQVVVAGSTVLVPAAPPIGSRIRTFWRRR
jgi:type IV pilus assembly protein PilY1